MSDKDLATLEAEYYAKLVARKDTLEGELSAIRTKLSVFRPIPPSVEAAPMKKREPFFARPGRAEMAQRLQTAILAVLLASTKPLTMGAIARGVRKQSPKMSNTSVAYRVTCMRRESLIESNGLGRYTTYTLDAGIRALHEGTKS